jgi:hypothetical protein
MPIFRAIFPTMARAGKWDSGDFVMFEVNNKTDMFEICLVLSENGMPREYFEYRDKLQDVFKKKNEEVIWSIRCDSCNHGEILKFFNDFLQKDILELETKILCAFISLPKELTEGEKKEITATRYERNKMARKLCLSYHGKICKKCGLDVNATFGKKYEGIIEVHHVIPISEIGENYIVNPISDLMPVCPNCHAMIHMDLKNNK